MYQNITIIASDEHVLQTKLFKSVDPKACLLINGAMAVPSKIYHKFAQFMASQGVTTMVYDYRGVGENNHGQDASFADWATQDLPALIDYLATIHPKVHYLGHSIGGQILGIMPGQEKIEKVIFVACSSGTWWADKPLKSTLMAGFVMNIYIPLSNKFLGFTNAEAIKMGVNLPKTVANEWASWCRSKNFVLDHKHKYPSFKSPELTHEALDILIYDDDIATKASNLKHKEFYRNMHFTDYEVSADHPIGHLGLFKPENKNHWDFMLQWLLAL